MKHLTITLLCSSLLISGATVAHNKVVVIPMAGEDAISHPAAKTFTNSIGMQFNELPAGSFTMGSPVSNFLYTEPGRDEDENQHNVTLTKAFNMQVTEVTNAQWDEVITPNPSVSHVDPEYPVDSVSWYDAVFFANRLSVSEGRSTCYTFGLTGIVTDNDFELTNVAPVSACTGYRLPTEAEWEYAARAGTSKAYANPIGFDASDVETDFGFNGNLHAMGWYTHNNTGMGYTIGTKPVAKKQPNAWGLYDMHGNVYEWNWDWYAAYPEFLGLTLPATDPVGPVDGSVRVIRVRLIATARLRGIVSTSWVSGLFCPKASSQVA
jgi:formylglycine-generating enzyme required for sulfatase activity